MTDVISANKNDDLMDLEAGEQTYLLSGEQPKGEGADPEVKEAIPHRTNYKELAVKGAAILSTGASAGALVVMGSNPLVLVSSGIGVLIGPYAAVQETQITDLEALKDVNEAMTKEVDALAAENERLVEQMQELEGSLSRLEEMEEALTAIKKTESKNVDDMEDQLERSKKILGSMEQNMQATVLQNIISVVLRSDLDDDQYLDDDEIDLLLRKLHAYDTVTVDDEGFKKIIIDEGRSLAAVMKIVKTILSDDIPDEEQVIRISDI